MKTTFLLFFLVSFAYAQQPENNHIPSHFISGEYLVGYSLPVGEAFLKTYTGKGLFVHLGTFQDHNPHEWAYRLRYPKIGISLGVIDFQKVHDIGYAFTAMPFLEFSPFKNDRFKIHSGIGAAFISGSNKPPFDRKLDVITTNLNWSFELFFKYNVFQYQDLDFTLGMGYFHYSNGHTRLPNIGLNALMLSTSIAYTNKKQIEITKEKEVPSYTRSSYYALESNVGLGIQVLSDQFNTHKNVYSISLLGAKVYNNTLKVGVGVYYRFYDHFYDYINNNEQLIRESYTDFKDAPFRYSTNFGVYLHGELLLNHIGIITDVGYNIHKPFYEVERLLSQTFSTIQETPNGSEKIYIYGGKLNGGYRLRKAITSRLGVRYYLKSTENNTAYNYFIGANIKANAGQADFSELSMGMTYSFMRSK
ncbi:acyloxyacyl hydrolase [uncultured Dokdonia sp.]|uniref:acyloxyacyl hydrolase n=1 Tax=uncultured Dokdonia sp. TaxID=575653 RepID=UPI002635CA6F|nr:acyloxyacyl hydrolase [uncultured Dokdonia sp.]